jgi:hypothetical protein
LCDLKRTCFYFHATNFARSGEAHLEIQEIEVCLEIKDNHLETMSVFVHVKYTFFFSFPFLVSKITKTGGAF